MLHVQLLLGFDGPGFDTWVVSVRISQSHQNVDTPRRGRGTVNPPTRMRSKVLEPRCWNVSDAGVCMGLLHDFPAVLKSYP